MKTNPPTPQDAPMLARMARIGLVMGKDFDPGKLPPAMAFWSLTMYDSDFFFVPNPINRYYLAQRDTLLANPDGSVDMYLQADSPGKDKEANWLPEPRGKFLLVMRIYAPRKTPPSILDGSWTPPPVRRVP